MTWQASPYVPVMAVAAGVAFAVGVLLWRHREGPGGVYVSLLLFALTVWAGAYAAGYARADPGGKLLAARVAYVGVGLAPVLWLAFAVCYSRRTRLSRRRLLALATPLAVTAAATWVSPALPLMWTDARLVSTPTGVYLAQPYGPLFWFHSAYASVLLLAGTALFVTTAVGTTGTHRAQAAGLLGVAAVPWLANVGYLLGLFPVGFDPTPLGFVASALLLGSVHARYRLLDAVPAARGVARDAAVEGMDDPVFVLRDDGTVTDCNPAGASLAGTTPRALLGTPLADALPDLAAVANASVDADPERPTYVRSGSGCDRSYDVRVSRFSRGGLLGGRIVTLRDVTERRRHERRLSVLNRILRHDLRNDINVIVGYANLLDPAADDAADLRPVERIRGRADEMLALTEKVREAEAALDRRGSSVTTVDLGGVLRDVVSTARADVPDATVRLDAPERMPVRGTALLDSVFDNLVENALEHNDAPDPRVTITATRTPTAATVTVRDNGPGLPDAELDALACDRESQLEHASGFGLWLVTWLVEESGGRADFEANDAGTTVSVRLPLAGTETELPDE